MRGPTIRTVALALAGVSLAGIAAPGVAEAQAQSSARRNFDIPAQDMAGALEMFGHQSGRDILFDRGRVAGLRSSTVRGTFEPENALRRLVGRSGLSISAPNGGTFVVGRGSPAAEGNDSASDDGSPGGNQSEITVVGTRIRGAGPVGAQTLTIDRQQLENSGYGTVQDYLRTIPQFGPSAAQPDNFTRQPLNTGNAAFGSGLDLRGLGNGTTLVLINGRRQPGAGTSGSFVDISTIPASAVERIDILLDGASAIYGSDAIGGVVNIVLRDDFRGAQTNLRVGTYNGDAEELRLGQSFGFSWSGGHVFFGGEYYRRTQLDASSRDYSRNSDQRPRGGDDFSSPLSNPGNILDPATFQVAYAIPRGQDGRSLTPADLLPGQVNIQNVNEHAALMPGETVYSGFVNLTQRLTDKLELSAQGRYSRRPFSYQYAGSPLFVIVPSSNAFFVDPFGNSDSLYVYYDSGPDFGLNGRGATEAYDGSLTATYEIGRWRAIAVGSYAKLSLFGLQESYNFDAFTAALADSNPATAYNVFGDGVRNNQQTVASIIDVYTDRANSNTISAELSFDGPLFRLPGGEARLAFGSSYLRDQENTGTAEIVGDPFGRSPQLTRSDRAVYAELSLPLLGTTQEIPLISRLDLSMAGRYDSYSDVGDTFNPKFGVAWSPISNLTFRGTWGTSFRAPPLSVLDGTVLYPRSVVINTLPSPEGPTRVLLLSGANPGIRPETANTFAVGFDLRLNRGTTHLSGTFTDIRYQDRIGRAGTPGRESQILLEENLWAVAINRNPTPEEIQAACALSNQPCGATPPQVIVDRRLRNLAYTRSQSIDLRADQTFNFDHSTIVARLNAAYNIRNERSIVRGAPVVDILNTVGNPLKLRAIGSLEWTSGPFFARGAVNFSNSYTDPVIRQVVDREMSNPIPQSI